MPRKNKNHIRPRRRATVASLVKAECANWHGGCIWQRPCPARGYRCKYFEEAVLAAFPEFKEAYLTSTKERDE